MNITPIDVTVNAIMICITTVICRAVFPIIADIPGMPEFAPWAIVVSLGGVSQILAMEIRNRIKH